jgi:hypothetical protein
MNDHHRAGLPRNQADQSKSDPLGQDRRIPDRSDLDHWEMFADAMDLTIEGHRLIAQEIAFEAKALWRMLARRFRDAATIAMRRRSSPPA